eukprot:c1239_g1_i1.p1 GENE.c1239_g1_i1~~c1239_g1_i1.p1  ORF type:complete len:429 (-),score=107.72 c1239_g1_i1:362-1648(-)
MGELSNRMSESVGVLMHVTQCRATSTAITIPETFAEKYPVFAALCDTFNLALSVSKLNCKQQHHIDAATEKIWLSLLNEISNIVSVGGNQSKSSDELSVAEQLLDLATKLKNGSIGVNEYAVKGLSLLRGRGSSSKFDTSQLTQSLLDPLSAAGASKDLSNKAQLAITQRISQPVLSAIVVPVTSIAPPHAQQQQARQLKLIDVAHGTQEYLLLNQLPNNATVTYLTTNKESWIIKIPAFSPATESTFATVWEAHPPELGVVYFNNTPYTAQRFHKTYGQSYTFSGQTLSASPLTELPFAKSFVDFTNNLMSKSGLRFRYAMCLVNWYEPNHWIRAHSDDEQVIAPQSPIFSLSWGSVRTFRITAKSQSHSVIQNLDVSVANGDLVIMGGAMQSTHKHEIIPVPPEELPATGRRINFTLRSFRMTQSQ